jgi:hypothetical protein
MSENDVGFTLTCLAGVDVVAEAWTFQLALSVLELLELRVARFEVLVAGLEVCTCNSIGQ